MRAIRTYLANAKHTTGCPASIDPDGYDDINCTCGLAAARVELDGLRVLYTASYYDDRIVGDSVDDLARAAQRHSRYRPARVTASVTFGLSAEEQSRFDREFDRHNRTERNTELERQLLSLQKERERIVSLGLADIDMRIKRIEAEIKALGESHD